MAGEFIFTYQFFTAEVEVILFLVLGIIGFFGLCPLSDILKTREHNVSETGSVSALS
jgi:hypothetical protein